MDDQIIGGKATSRCGILSSTTSCSDRGVWQQQADVSQRVYKGLLDHFDVGIYKSHHTNMSILNFVILSLSLATSALAGIKKWDSPDYTPWIFQFPLPFPPIKTPSTSYTRPDGRRIDFYEINVQKFEKQIYPNLNTTTLVGYDGIAPGPTFHMTKGTEAVVRYINRYERPISIHLHGSYSRTPFDGWAEDVTNQGQYKDYVRCAPKLS